MTFFIKKRTLCFAPAKGAPFAAASGFGFSAGITFFGENFLKIFVTLIIMAALHGCAARREAAPELTPAPETPRQAAAGLTGAEAAIFHSKGEIDGQVPSDALGDVAAEYKYYLREGRKTIEVSSKRAEPYIEYARKVFRERGMPEELANLAIVESGYRANAVSRAGAAGAWQFMPETGLKYGLAQDWWQDERLDPYKATEAAADYLQKLYNDFGDWPTAIAAYNAGEGKISRAKAGTGGKDFFEVKAKNHVLNEKERLRDETKQYVPRFLAVSKIMRNLPKLGFAEMRPGVGDGVLRYTVTPGTDLRELCSSCDIDWETFTNYNQHHKRNITCTDKQTFIYVPASVGSRVANYLCTDKKANFAGWRPATAKRGDSLEKISQRANVPLEKLRAANPGLGSLKAGQVILVPANTKMIAGKTREAAKKGAKNSAPRVYVIQSNDTLFSIAKKFNVDVGALMVQNGIADPGKLRKGQNLAIPGAETNKKSKTPIQKKESPAAKKSYMVRAKDNLWKIARRHNVSVEDLKRWNGVDEKSLKAGALLVVDGDKG